MAKIEYEILGNTNFLRKAEYNAHLYNFLTEFGENFLLAETVFIKFEDYINSNPNATEPNLLSFSDDGKIITLLYRTSRYFLPNGKISLPTPEDFYESLKYYLKNKVVKADNERFEKLDSNRD